MFSLFFSFALALFCFISYPNARLLLDLKRLAPFHLLSILVDHTEAPPAGGYRTSRPSPSSTYLLFPSVCFSFDLYITIMALSNLHHRLPTLLCLCIISLAPLVLGQTPKCYFPSGGVDSIGVPCNSTAGAQSACCNSYDACFSSGMCYTPLNGATYRRSCTDPTFADSSCPQKCTQCESPPTHHHFPAPERETERLNLADDKQSRRAASSRSCSATAWAEGALISASNRAAPRTARTAAATRPSPSASSRPGTSPC